MTVAPSPVPTLSDGDNSDDVAHYARKEEIARAAIEGGLITALCGVRFPPVRDPSRFPVCRRCAALLNQLNAARRGAN